MKKIEMNILRSVAKTSMKVASDSPNTMSVFYFYEPKMPEKLQNVMNNHNHRTIIDL